jgi:cyclopropane fatty-acyl-phospholipid synthase-like methyltransferase
MTKKHSPSCDRNSQPIFEVLKEYIATDTRLLEIGSGTGQHAVYFAEKFENLHWVTSDVVENHKDIQATVREVKLVNVHGPEVLKVGVDDFPGKRPFDYVFTANTLHIMSWKEDKTLFKLLGKRLREGSVVFFYGPFNYDGKFTSPSNEEFDKWLKVRSPKSGIRAFEDIEASMKKSGFKLLKDHEMPSNNRLLAFERLAYSS